MNRKNWILLVDDDASVRDLVARVLTGEGYGVIAAADGEEALTLAGCMRMDLSLLDLKLPKRTGWDTFERLTSEDPLLPVIVITARSHQLFTALGAGVGALMEKPLDIHQLLDTVRKLLAESTEARLSRVTGHPAPFYYVPTDPSDAISRTSKPSAPE
jgi:DNA-binding response OmpR family regulator